MCESKVLPAELSPDAFSPVSCPAECRPGGVAWGKWIYRSCGAGGELMIRPMPCGSPLV
jgi:hypothetical protein